jgi:DNA-binding NarL/FixJ family response regulator
MISVALIDENRLAREAISSMLNGLPEIRVVAGDGGDMLRFREIDPEVVLLHIGLPDGDGLRTAEQVRTALPRAKVVAMDSTAVQQGLVDWVHVGVAGFITKDATLEDLVCTIRSVVKGVKVLPPQMTETLFSQITRTPPAVGEVDGDALDSVGITPREREVISLIAEGLTNKGIAGRLHIATPTVKSHVRNIMEKLALRTRLQIAAYAHRLRLSHQSEAGA